MAGAARQINERDFELFDLLICLDESHLEHLRGLGAPEAKLRLLMECDLNAGCREVPDPYYGEQDGFETCYRMTDQACEALLTELLAPRDSESES